MSKFTFAAPVDIQAAAGEGIRPSFTIAAYTGAPMNANGFSLPVVVDLSGLKAAGQELPILLDHDPTRIVGQASQVTIDKTGVSIAGTVTGDDADANKVVSHARNGFKWKASIGASVTRKEFLQAGSKATVNGRTVTGPLVIARASELQEVSFVAIAADGNTSAAIAASYTKHNGQNMDFDNWLQAKGWDGASLNDGQRTSLKAAYDAEQRPSQDTDLETVLAAQRQDRERIGSITNMTASALQDYPSRSAEIETLSRLACSTGWTTDRYELELLRAMRTSQAKPFNGRDEIAGDVIEAALAKSCGINPEDHYSERTLEAADRRFRHGISLKEVLLMAARANGEYHDVSTRNVKALLKAAFSDVRASGFSSLSLPTLFSNVSNKIALDAFNAVESEWRKIAAIASVGDFKQTTSFSLTGDLTFEEVGPTGELKHGTLGEETYNNQAKSYGKLMGLDRRDIINDDTGALTRVPKRMGRGGALKLNEVFWRIFLNNAAFFTEARGNLDVGADTAFSADALAMADVMFRAMTDPDGNQLGSLPALLLVPPALRIAALRLMRSQQIYADSEDGGSNPWAGAFDVVSSQYMTNSKFTGSSAKKWYLLASPADLPVIEVAFLDGRQEPMVESAEPTPDYLGIIYQGVYDFGVALQEHRGGVAMKGEN